MPASTDANVASSSVRSGAGTAMRQRTDAGAAGPGSGKLLTSFCALHETEARLFAR